MLGDSLKELKVKGVKVVSDVPRDGDLFDEGFQDDRYRDRLDLIEDRDELF